MNLHYIKKGLKSVEGKGKNVVMLKRFWKEVRAGKRPYFPVEIPLSRIRKRGVIRVETNTHLSEEQVFRVETNTHLNEEQVFKGI